MSCSVNLVPTVQAHARARARRRAGWITACLAAGVLLASGWCIQRVATRALTRLSGRVTTLQAQRSQLQQHLLVANAQAHELLAQLQTIAAARRPHPWARRLTTLTRAAPQGVCLTQVSITTPNTPASSALAPGPGRRGSSPRRNPEPAPPASSEPVEVRLLGYALDHAALIQLLHTLQSFPDWQQVELVRATLEPYRSGLAVAFELGCRTQGGPP